AFDLPTQTGYDSDHVLAKGEVGKVGVPICHLGDMRALFEQIPLGEMNTSMTINATAAWLLALYIAVADEQGAPRAKLQGTTQNDIVKEYLSRGTYVFPPAPSMRLIKDTILFTTAELPKWNPINVCSYHLQGAGATPVQELAYALATAIAVLDTVKASGEVKPEAFGEVVGRISFFVNAGLRFITEMCKMRAFCELWDEITHERYGVTDPKQRLFRYGVQVNSLGLTEPQAENNVYRILIEMLAVTLSRDARARAVQLPAWNEALGLPRPWDQQWSLRMQQILAYETDLLEYPDILDGSKVVRRKVGVTTGEWGATLRSVLGAYRGPTGISGGLAASGGGGLEEVRAAVERVSARLGRRIKLLVGKPGLDGHSNGAEQIAVRARDCGMEVVYEGIRLTPARIVRAAVEESVHVVGLSIRSGSHVPLVGEVMGRMRKEGLDDVAVVVGGVIPPEDAL